MLLKNIEVERQVTWGEKQYITSRAANEYTWILRSVENKRETITMNREQMIQAGFREIVEE